MQTSTVLGRWYKDGEIICRQGERGDCMYFIEEGEVELMRREGSNEFCVAMLKAGEFWGEAGLLQRDHLRTATARAIGDTSILSVEKRMFLSRIQEDPSFVLKVMRKMSQRIHELETALVRTANLPAVPVVASHGLASAPNCLQKRDTLTYPKEQT